MLLAASKSKSATCILSIKVMVEDTRTLTLVFERDSLVEYTSLTIKKLQRRFKLIKDRQKQYATKSLDPRAKKKLFLGYYSQRQCDVTA